MAATNASAPGKPNIPLICVKQQGVYSKGFWLNDNPLDYPMPLIMAQIILVLFITRLLYYLLRPFGQTKFVCNLLGGIILGPSMLGKSQVINAKLFRRKDSPILEILALLGAIYSMFIIAVKFDKTMVRRTAKSGWKISIPGLILPLGVTIALAQPIGSTIPSFKGGTFFLYSFLSTLSFSFFPVIAQTLSELNLMTSELGQLAMSSTLVTEGFQWISTAAHIVFTKNDPAHGAMTMISILALIIFTFTFLRSLVLLVIKNTPEGKEVKETYVVMMLLGVLVIAATSDAIGATSLVGPILFGLIIPDGSALGATLIKKTEFVVSEFFLPILFFRVGFMTNVYSFSDWGSIGKVQLIISLTYGAKILGVAVAALCCKINLKNSLLLSFIMNIKGLVDLVILTRWRSSQLIGEDAYTQIVFSMLVMTVVVTPVLRFSYKPQTRLGPSEKNVCARNLQSSRNNFEFHILCCVHSEESVRSITTLLESSNPTIQSPVITYIIRAVELVGRAAPMLVPYKDKRLEEGSNRLKRSNTPTHQMMRAFENYSKNSKGPVSIHAFTMIAPYKSMHEILCNLAEDNNIPLILLPFHENHQYTVGTDVTASIRHFNVQVQTYSPCTVGILVERGLSTRLSVSHFSYNVGLFFVGGPDDREALAYASRMSGNPDVGITVFRIIFRNKLINQAEMNFDMEEGLDEALVDEFKIRNIGNDCVTWRDIEVDDSVQLMDAIRNSQGDYDLVMVGRRKADMLLSDEEMAAFVQNPELGVIGDMLASSDFCSGMVNVLVLQESMELSCGIFCKMSRKGSIR